MLSPIENSTPSGGSDRIERRLVLRAPREQVWRALTSPDEFGAYLGWKLAGTFAVGERLSGRPLDPNYQGCSVVLTVERLVPREVLSYSWHPQAVDPQIDYEGEPTTLVEFRLEETSDSTVLTVTESGFDHIRSERLLPARYRSWP
jgi:uncharacterized protein YndB with AHSA1/START domain